MHRLGWIALVVLSMLAATGSAGAGTLHPDVEAQISALPPGGTVSVIVEMTDQADLRTARAAARGLARAARARAIKSLLENVATRGQGPIRALLAREQALGTVQEATPFWVFNGLAVTATEPIIRQLAARDDVWEVRPDRKIAPPTPVPAEAAPLGGISEWNIAQIRAPEVWAMDPSYNGAGVVLGSFDTGVDGTHPDLAPRYRGNDKISWFDPYKQHKSPFDGNGHGTHTTGTAIGGEAGGTHIGVAPGATWIAAKGWNNRGTATTSAFHKIFQWFLAPDGNPANAPHVVNMSWSFLEPECDPEFQADIQAFRAAGIFPVFAAGNDGPDPGSARSPGAYPEAFAVGATDFFDNVAYFSARGPSNCDGAVKPNVTAPGDGIRSTVPGGYAIFSGTSMAAPHVAGAVAVLLSINPAATLEELETALELGVVDLGPTGPDNDYGTGRIDLFVSAQVVQGGADRPMATISATDPQGFELGTIPATFAVSRTGPTDADLTVYYTVSGTATPGTDYVALPGSVTIPAGSQSAVIVVTPIDDTVPELEETVIVSLSLDPAYIVGNPGSATVSVVSDEIPPDLVVSALAVPATAEAGATLTVTDTTKNVGGPADASTTRFYLSANTVLDAADVPLGSRTVPPLGAGASSAGTTVVTIPPGTAAGFHYVLARADADDAIDEITEGNNTALAAIQIGPDLIVLSIWAPANAGAGATISVSDNTKNQGGGAAGPSTTKLYFSSDITPDPGDTLLGSRAVPTLGAGASSIGSTTVTIPAGAAVGLYYLIVTADADNAVSESQESNNIAFTAIRIGPDLVVSALSAPSSASAGAAITVTDTTKNQGGGAAGVSTTKLFFSANSTLDAGDALLGTRAVPALPAGVSSTGATSVTLPTSLAVGTYYLIAQADGTSAVAETEEANNVALVPVQVGPDLVLTALSAPPVAEAGAAISVSDTTKNQGGPTDTSTTRFYLSTDSVLDGADVMIGGRTVPALAAGASDAATTVVTLPAGLAAGLYYLIAKADADSVVTETQESNNTALTNIQVGPDLVIAALSTSSAASAGAALDVSDTTKNQGGGAAGASTTRFYLSTNTILDAGDTLLGSRAVSALVAGVASAGTTTLTLPAGLAAGTYYVLAKADADNDVGETQEANNVGITAVHVGADLVVASLSAPATAETDATITVSDTTKNQSGSAAGGSTTRFYLSTDALLDAGDLVLGSRAVPALAAGATSSGSTALTLPTGLPAGFYYLFAKADADDVLMESAETNNTALTGIRVGPDLHVLSLGAPSAAAAGAAIAVTDTTRNQGGGAAGASTARFFFSTDPYLDAGDLVLGSRAVPALAAGASSAGATTVTLPTGLAVGTYYILAQADADSVVGETDEANNVALTPIRIGPDLVITTFSAPVTAGAGDTITLTDTTSNQSGSTADTSTTRFALSTDPTLDAGDLTLGSRAVPPLGGGASSAGTTTATLPTGLVPGIYYLIAKADADDLLVESQEANNLSVRTIQLGPDLVVSALSAPGTAAAGATLSVSDTVRNQGGGAAGVSTTRLYFSVNTTLDAGDTFLGSHAVPLLASGASSPGTTSVTLPAGLAAGTYYILAKADADDAVAETLEANNVAAAAVLIGTDLIISALTAPATAEAGATITVSDTTKNLSGSAANASTTRFHLSSNALLDAADVVLGSRAVPALDAGAISSGSTAVTIPPGTPPGFYYLLAQADADGVVPEIQEGNNVGVAGVRIGPDLVVLSLWAPGGAATGGTISISDTTKNQGGGLAAASATRFFFSTDPYLDAGDVVLGSRAVPTLAAAASSVGTTTVTLPTGLAVGTYYILVRADGDGVVAETDEANNVALTSIRIGPDLTISALTAPSTAAAGAMISVTDTTLNQGGDAAGLSTTRIYLSTNTVLDAGDAVLGNRAVPALGAGTPSAGATAVTIPAGTAAGTYYLFVQADADDVVTETFETNNTTLRSITVTP